MIGDSAHRMSPRQKERPRMTLLERAHLYHYSRMYLNGMYRQRSPLDDRLIRDLVELSLSQYTRLRRYCQSVLRYVSEVRLPYCRSAAALPTPHSVTFVPPGHSCPLSVIR